MAKHNDQPAHSHRISPGLRALAVLAVIAAFWPILNGARDALRRYLGQCATYRISAERITVSSQPPWILADVRHAVMSRSIDASELTLTDRDLVGRLAGAFLASPWVADASVRKSDDSIAVTLKYRKPVLCVPWGDDQRREGCYVDGRGVLLPADEADPDCFRDCFVVEGLGPDVLAAIGAPAHDARLAGIASLAELLSKHKRELDLLVLIVTSGSAEPCSVSIRTIGGSRVVWGTLDGAGVKLQCLQDVHCQWGSLDGAGGPFEVDLTAAETPVPVRIVDKYRLRP